MNKNYDYKRLTPFKWFVLQNFPFIDEDFDAITNYQLFCKLGEEINKLIESMNLAGQQVEELTNFVNNYFDNLDVQEEINNKLDEMAEQGQLTDIIAQYLQLAGLLCFNTKADMKNAKNLANGSFAKTYGTTTYKDGYGEFYKIRKILNTDVVDDDNIIALTNYNDLIAEKIPNAKINSLNSVVSSLQNDVEDLQETVNKDRLLIIGDSWSAGTNKWHTYLAAELGLTVDNFARGGAGFVHSDTQGYTFAEQIVTAYNTLSAENRNKIKYIIVYGGVNDWRNGVVAADIKAGIQAVITNAKQYFPNAKLYIIPLNIGKANQSIYNGFASFRSRVIHDALSLGNANICQSASFWLMSYGSVWAESSGEILHPNATGYKIIASYMLSILRGTYDGVHRTITDDISDDGSGLNIQFDNGILSFYGIISGLTGNNAEIFNDTIGIFQYIFGTNPTNLFGVGVILGGSQTQVTSPCVLTCVRSSHKVLVESRNQTFNNNTVIINSSFSS